MSTAILTGQPVPGSSIEGDLRSLGFDVRSAADAAEAETLLAAVPGEERVALVDARFVGHLHALRLGLTDPRFPLAAIPGAVTAQPAGRQALTRAMARENSAGGGTAPRSPSTASPTASSPPSTPTAPRCTAPSWAAWSPPSPPTRRPATRHGRPSRPSTTRPYA